MCGINGIWRSPSSSRLIGESLVDRMNESLAHRGPDDSGIWKHPSDRVVFGHRRLSIIDLSPGGHQPMIAASGNAIVYNGEIYNYKELQSLLPGVSFSSTSDTEVLLALYEKYGGRVIFQQAGIEPIDAYRDYLKDIEEKGDLMILKSDYADVFDEFKRYMDMGHNYLSERGDKFFGRPYWETVDLDAEQRERIEELKAIPHK